MSESLDYLFTGQWDGVFYTNKRFLLYSQAQFLQLVWVPPYKPEMTDGLIYKLTVTMAKCSDVTILATSYFTHNVFGKCLRILYKNRSPGKSKQDIHLIFSVFIYSNHVERINKVLKKIGNRPETAKSAPSPCLVLNCKGFDLFILLVEVAFSLLAFPFRLLEYCCLP